MISYREALDHIVKNAQPLDPIKIGLNDAVGAVSAQGFKSAICTPAFDNSAMDGFAVRAEDTTSATSNGPLTLKVAGSVAAGDAPLLSTAVPQTACEIMTGGAVPAGYDAVVPIEEVGITKKVGEQPAEICLRSPVEIGSHIRRRGEDFKSNDVVLDAGALIRPRHIMGLASVGIRNITVHARPKVGVICTGHEIADESSAEALKPGQIHNSNAPYLCTMLSEMNVDVQHYDNLCNDNSAAFVQRIDEILARANPPHIILSTGAVSAGRWDFVPMALQNIGATIVFHKVRIRPGKPILFALLPNGSYFFGLPGNPISTAVGFRFFVVPLLRRLQGMTEEGSMVARLGSGFSKKEGLRCFYKANLNVDASGQCQVHVLREQESFKIRPFVEANGWAVLEEERTSYQAGDLLATYPFCPIV